MKVKTLEMLRLLSEDNRRCASKECECEGSRDYYNCFIEDDIVKVTGQYGIEIFYKLDLNDEWDIIEPELSTKEAFDEMILNDKIIQSALTNNVYCNLGDYYTIGCYVGCPYGNRGDKTCKNPIRMTKEEYRSTWRVLSQKGQEE